MRIIIMEQDAALGLFLKKGLTVEGHDVQWSDRPSEALDMAERQPPELMVLDVATEQGTDLLAAMQTEHRSAAILTLLRSDSVEDRVRSLDMGADDCMAKPFSFHELTARCRALLRRRERFAEITLTSGNLTLNRISRSASVRGTALTLTVKEFRLLEFLLENSGRCCSRRELLTEVFQLPPENATNVVDVYINYLRKKLGTLDDTVRIMTVRGTGYCLARATPEDRRAVANGINEQLHASA